ncbi:canopy family protein seele isoform X2 [Leptinotarsa decemlineata]|uniref:canopy family protein seele isoform X2 n=1 Tax=Leptinotarsa decemlineata TaxID=7539 RepID=UPI000C2534A4|nr:protein seele isoform X2 [Leptinotarsa decemlineata]
MIVCETSVQEVAKAINKLDPNKKVDVGGYRLDIDGNYNHKAISEAKSELALSEIIENVCEKMDNYVRATWKSNGTLTLLKMISDEGTMSPNFGDVDILQDDDLNKSLKYYCEEFMGEYEEDLIKLYQEEHEDVQKEFCVLQTKLCPSKKKVKQEL